MILFHEGIDQLMTAGNLENDTVQVYLVSAGFVPSATSVRADLQASAVEGSPQAVTSKAVANGVFTHAAPVFDDVVDLDDNITQVLYTITVGGAEYLLGVDTDPSLDPTGLEVVYETTAAIAIRLPAV